MCVKFLLCRLNLTFCFFQEALFHPPPQAFLQGFQRWTTGGMSIILAKDILSLVESNLTCRYKISRVDRKGHNIWLTSFSDPSNHSLTPRALQMGALSLTKVIAQNNFVLICSDPAKCSSQHSRATGSPPCRGPALRPVPFSWWTPHMRSPARWEQGWRMTHLITSLLSTSLQTSGGGLCPTELPDVHSSL